jgi:hypothetical protein
VLVAHCLRICLVQSAKKNWKNNQTAKKKKKKESPPPPLLVRAPI